MTTTINSTAIAARDARLEALLDECRAYVMTRFQEGEGKSTIRAFHLPYSGPSRPDYVDFFDYLEGDVRDLLVEVCEAGKPDKKGEITVLEGLKQAWEEIDDGDLLHCEVERSLTWQQGLRECEIILDNCEDVETDSGLWQGLEPTEAIRWQAFFTYRNEVRRRGLALIEEKMREELDE